MSIYGSVGPPKIERISPSEVERIVQKQRSDKELTDEELNKIHNLFFDILENYASKEDKRRIDSGIRKCVKRQHRNSNGFRYNERVDLPYIGGSEIIDVQCRGCGSEFTRYKTPSEKAHHNQYRNL